MKQNRRKLLRASGLAGIGVAIQALCDIRSERVDAVKKSLPGSEHPAVVYM